MATLIQACNWPATHAMNDRQPVITLLAEPVQQDNGHILRICMVNRERDRPAIERSRFTALHVVNLVEG
jgi:hypothetical protein